MLFVHEGTRRLRHDLRAAALRPGRLPRPADRHDLAPGPGRRLGAADAVPGVPVRDRAAEALSQRLRPAAGALPRTASATSASRTTSRRGPTRASSASTSVRDRITAYHYRHHPFDVVGWDGYLWPFTLQHRATSSRSPAGSTSRRRSTRPSRPATSSSARSCPASSTTTRWRSRRPTTTRTSTATRSSTTSPATS